MKRKHWLHLALSIPSVIVIAWATLTVYVELDGPAKEWVLRSKTDRSVLIVFDPDPMYNLDEKVCLSFAKALAEKEISAVVKTVAAAKGKNDKVYDAYVFCANTYNWRPDWSIVNYIEDYFPRSNASVVAITLGAGPTEASQQKLEEVITNSGAQLVDSYTLWLLKPNDETQMEKPNVDVAESMAYTWGLKLADKINGSLLPSNTQSAASR